MKRRESVRCFMIMRCECLKFEVNKYLSAALLAPSSAATR